MALTDLQRQERLRERRARDGLKEVCNLWVHPADEPAIRAFALKLSAKRSKRPQAPTPRP